MIYGNADDFRQYITLRGSSQINDFDDDKLESALLVASEWLDSQYEPIWIGYKAQGYKQERSWPRLNAIVNSFPFYVYGKDEIPEQVIKATYEAASRELTSSGYLQIDYTPSLYKRATVEGAVSVDFNDLIYSASDIQTEIPVIQRLMDQLIDPQKTGVISSLSGQAVRV